MYTVSTHVELVAQSLLKINLLSVNHIDACAVPRRPGPLAARGLDHLRGVLNVELASAYGRASASTQHVILLPKRNSESVPTRFPGGHPQS